MRVDVVWNATYSIGGVEGPPLNGLTVPGVDSAPLTVVGSDLRITR